MLHKLYSIGYLNPGSLEQIQQLVNQGALLVDIRFSARSYYRPWFTAKRLRSRFKTAYTRLRDLGNKNYANPNADIVLLNPALGIPQLLTLLEQQDVCLLCRCKKLAKCHTTVVLEAIQQSCPEAQLIRLGEEEEDLRYAS